MSCGRGRGLGQRSRGRRGAEALTSGVSGGLGTLERAATKAVWPPRVLVSASLLFIDSQRSPWTRIRRRGSPGAVAPAPRSDERIGSPAAVCLPRFVRPGEESPGGPPVRRSPRPPPRADHLRPLKMWHNVGLTLLVFVATLLIVLLLMVCVSARECNTKCAK
ncbi:hypothetical protein TREES_T100000111 [Tupaia chinensis]|uniref:Uncharacterized protein n=1 Tax=Tupaia chinensis TaxID=246437 RepID=L9LDB4_TUPCH|nr:hypothetical protein TREES_T100000111 [Tupaia chinensis]